MRNYIFQHDEDVSPKGSFFDIFEENGSIYLVCDGRYTGTKVTTYQYPNGTKEDNIMTDLSKGSYLYNLDWDTMQIVDEYTRQ